MTREQLVTVEDLLNLRTEILNAIDSNRQLLASLKVEMQEAGVIRPEKLHYSPKELALKLNVSVRTINNWIQEGSVEASQPNGFRGAWIIPKSEFERLSEGGYTKSRAKEFFSRN